MTPKMHLAFKHLLILLAAWRTRTYSIMSPNTQRDTPPRDSTKQVLWWQSFYVRY